MEDLRSEAHGWSAGDWPDRGAEGDLYPRHLCCGKSHRLPNTAGKLPCTRPVISPVFIRLDHLQAELGAKAASRDQQLTTVADAHDANDFLKELRSEIPYQRHHVSTHSHPGQPPHCPLTAVEPNNGIAKEGTLIWLEVRVAIESGAEQAASGGGMEADGLPDASDADRIDHRN